MSEELKPCPFCGGEAWLRQWGSGWALTCRNNRVLARLADFTERECPIAIVLTPTEAEAIAAWNTRTGEQAAYERGEAEERGRVAEALTGWMNASKAAADQWMNVNRTQFDLCYQTYDTLRQVIEIVNQVKE